MEFVTRATLCFPVTIDRPEDDNPTFIPNEFGMYSVWDDRGEEVCMCRTVPQAEAVAVFLNEAAMGSDEIALNMRF